MNCIPEAGYLDSPEFLSMSLHVTTLFATPIHFLGLFCILFRTPEQMKSVKWYLLALHLWTMIFDYSMTILIVPMFFIPVMAGISYGLLNLVGLPVFYQVAWGAGSITAVLVSITSIFENRFYILCQFPGKRWWSTLRRGWLAFHYFLIIVVLCFILDTPDQETAKRQVFQILPCLPEYIYNGPVFVLTLDYTRVVIPVACFVVILVVEVAVFGFTLAVISIRQLLSKSISEKTFQLQKKFFLALVIQMIVPLTMFIFTLLYCAFVCYKNYYNQAGINLCVLIICLHGLVSTTVMLLIHKPYRDTVISMVSRNASGRRKMSTTVAVLRPNFSS